MRGLEEGEFIGRRVSFDQFDLGVNVASAFNLFAGTLRNLGQYNGGAPLTVAATGVMALAGTNAYTGGTVLNSGQLNLHSAGALGAGALTINGIGAGVALLGVIVQLLLDRRRGRKKSRPAEPQKSASAPPPPPPQRSWWSRAGQLYRRAG